MAVASSNNLILSDGSIIAAGWSAGNTPICYALAKYGSNGVLSTKVASAVSTGSGSAYSAEHSGIALQANAEKIVTAGWVSNGSDNDFFIARYNVSNLGLDTSFDGDGMLSTTFGSGNGDVAYGVAIQPDGRIIAVGSTTTPGSGGATDFAIARRKVSGAAPYGGAGGYFTRVGLRGRLTDAGCTPARMAMSRPAASR